jgi:hypothetical protein
VEQTAAPEPEAPVEEPTHVIADVIGDVLQAPPAEEEAAPVEEAEEVPAEVPQKAAEPPAKVEVAPEEPEVEIDTTGWTGLFTMIDVMQGGFASNHKSAEQVVKLIDSLTVR